MAVFASIWKLATDEGRSRVWTTRTALFAAAPQAAAPASQRQPVEMIWIACCSGVAEPLGAVISRL